MSRSVNSPVRRRRSSVISGPLTPGVTQGSHASLAQQGHTRRSSSHSLRTPTRPPSILSQGGDSIFSSEHDEPANIVASEGLESLADELGSEEWNEDDEEDPNTTINGGPSPLPAEDSYAAQGHLPRSPSPENSALWKGAGGPYDTSTAAKRYSLKAPMSLRSDPLQPEDEANLPDIDERSELSFELERAVKSLEHSCLMGSNSRVYDRMEASLQDTGSQMEIESRSARLATAHLAIAVHLADQTRAISGSAQSLLSSGTTYPSADMIEQLCPLLATLIAATPQATEAPLAAMLALHSSTVELIDAMASLSDSFNVAKQTTILAARRLRATRDSTERLRREMGEAERAILWLENGSWEQRLKERQAASVCREVVGGFEETCRGWRQRLVDSVGGAELTAA